MGGNLMTTGIEILYLAVVGPLVGDVERGRDGTAVWIFSSFLEQVAVETLIQIVHRIVERQQNDLRYFLRKVVTYFGDRCSGSEGKGQGEGEGRSETWTSCVLSCGNVYADYLYFRNLSKKWQCRVCGCTPTSVAIGSGVVAWWECEEWLSDANRKSEKERRERREKRKKSCG